jgi:ribose transport system permease protein
MLSKTDTLSGRRPLARRQVLDFLRNAQSYLGLLVVVIVASLICTRNGRNLFLSSVNIANVVRSVSENGIMAIGMTLVILIGGIDLSVGAILGLTATTAASLMMHQGFGFAATIAAVLVFGAAFGLFNGLVTTKLRIQPFIATLASMSIARGLARMISGGIGVPIAYGTEPGFAPPAYELLSIRLWGVLPVPAICFLGLAAVFIVVLRFTRFGRYVYAIGGNETATHLSGINVDGVKVAIFALCGLLSAVAGLIHAAQLNQGSPNDGMGYELNVMAAVAIGGTSLSGGKGSITGTIVGALTLGVLDNMLGLKNVDNNFQMIAKGFIIILAVVLQRERKTS